MNFVKGEMIYEGKAKKIFSVKDEPDLVWIDYKDSLTAFNALKKGSFEKKGEINCQITLKLYDHLKKSGIDHHIVSSPSGKELVCKKVTIIPLEVVVRNRLAGSTAKKFGIEEGLVLSKPLVEFYYKDDALADPFVSDDQALFMKAVEKQSDLEELKTLGLKVNESLKSLFSKMGIDLVDFKMEFGRTKEGKVILADEITPDTCRLWDQKTGEKLDKDRFRRDLGNVEEAYQDILNRLKKVEG